MRPIPPELKEEMSNDIYYKQCCLSSLGNCSNEIQWHHNLIFGGKQVNEKFCILPVCKYHHDIANNRYIRERLDHIMLQRATDEQLKPFCKAINWIERKKTLAKMYV